MTEDGSWRARRERYQGRMKAQWTVSGELIGHWGIAREALTRQDRQGLGSGVIRRLAEDLRSVP